MRMSVPAATAAIALGLPVLFTNAPAALAAPDTGTVFVEANPSTVPAGDNIGVRAGCDDANTKTATVTSSLFGSTAVNPQFGFLTATVKVPAGTRPGDYQVNLRCSGGQTAATTLHVVAKVLPARGPATGGGGTRPGRNAPVLLAGGGLILAAGLALGGVSVRRRRFG